MAAGLSLSQVYEHAVIMVMVNQTIPSSLVGSILVGYCKTHNFGVKDLLNYFGIFTSWINTNSTNNNNTVTNIRDPLFLRRCQGCKKICKIKGVMMVWLIAFLSCRNVVTPMLVTCNGVSCVTWVGVVHQGVQMMTSWQGWPIRTQPACWAFRRQPTRHRRRPVIVLSSSSSAPRCVDVSFAWLDDAQCDIEICTFQS